MQPNIRAKTHNKTNIPPTVPPTIAPILTEAKDAVPEVNIKININFDDVKTMGVWHTRRRCIDTSACGCFIVVRRRI